MEDADGLSFDFEGGLDSGPSHSFSPGCSTRKLILRRRKPDTKLRSFLRDGSRSWKRTGLPSDCLQTLASRSVYESRSLRVPPSVRQSSYAYLPVLPVTRECREQDCVYKHTNADIKECNMYKLGFCPNGSDCRYRHAKLSGPPPPVEEVLQKIQQLTSYNHGPNRFYQPRNVAPQLGDVKPQVQFQTQGQLQESGNLQQQQPQQTQHQVSQTQTPNPAEQTSHAHPLPRGVNRYFVVKSCNLENFELSVQRGVWATQRSNEAKLNEAFDSVANVILIFSVNRGISRAVLR